MSDNEMRQWWFDHGFKLIPIKYKSKLPDLPTGGVNQVASNPQTQETWKTLFPESKPLNTGAIYPEDVLVLDAEKNTSMKTLVEEIPELLNTLNTGTGNGGHFFVKKPVGFTFPMGMLHSAPWDVEKLEEQHKEIEIRYNQPNQKFYSLVPPSVHPNGKDYIFINQQEILDIPDIENKLLTLAEKNRWRLSVNKDTVKNSKPLDQTNQGLLDFYKKIQDTVPLKKIAEAFVKYVGDNARGRCPVHGASEKHPSPCAYYEDRWVCYSTGCNEAGDVIKLYALFNNLRYHEAAIRLATEWEIEDNFKTSANTTVERLNNLGKETKPPENYPPEKEFTDLDLALNTEHLPHFEDFRKALGLVHDGQYTTAEKLVYYSLLGVVLTWKNSNQPPIYSIGGMKTDSRISINIVAPQGAGKQNIIDIGANLSKKLGFTSHQSNRIPNAKQTVGKIIIHKKPEKKITGTENLNDIYDYITNPGIFSNDLVSIDEATQFFTDEKEPLNQDLRANYRVATNTFGSNLIEDKSVDTPPDRKLSYCPPVTIWTFSQPLPIPASVIIEGTMRRPCTVYIPFTGDVKEQVKNRILAEGQEFFNTALERYAAWLRGRKNPQALLFSEEAKETFIHACEEIMEISKTQSSTVAEWTRWNLHTLTSKFLSFVYNLASALDKTEVDSSTVLMAYGDFREILASEWAYADWAYVLTVKPVRLTLNTRHIKFLQWLIKNKAYSPSFTPVSYENAKTYLMQELNYTQLSARGVIRGLKNRGILTGHQVGAHSAELVILSLPPGFKDFVDVNEKSGEGGVSTLLIETLYSKSVLEQLKEKISPLTPLPSSPSSNNNSNNNIIYSNSSSIVVKEVGETKEVSSNVINQLNPPTLTKKIENEKNEGQQLGGPGCSVCGISQNVNHTRTTPDSGLIRYCSDCFEKLVS